MKSKFGVVSSFDVLCGNATYSEAIANGLEHDYKVYKIDVPIDLQKNYEAELVSELCVKIRECERVNIQMELGLFGPTPEKAFKVLKKVMGACNSFSITMHRVETRPSNVIRQAYSCLKTGSVKSLFAVLGMYFVQKAVYKYYSAIINEAVRRGGSFIVHTVREERKIKKINARASVRVFPIVWPEESIEAVNLMAKFEHDYPIIGLFGFISEYKNYEVVADGLINESFNVFIAGGTHPQAPFYGKKSTDEMPSYIRKISNRFSVLSFRDRVLIEAAPTDEQLIQYMKSVDVVCVPYAETGQSGSGIASLAIQYGKRVIFSDTHCTSELVRFLNKRPVIFDVDSPLGLCCAVKDVLNSSEKVAFNGYDFVGLLSLYKEVS